MQPVLDALQILGGSGRNDEIYAQVLSICQIPENILALSHGKNGSQSEIEYRLAWARTYLKKSDIIENSARGVWSLTLKGREIKTIEVDKIVSHYKEDSKKNPSMLTEDIEISNDEENWKNQLHSTLLTLSPDAFERLAQRLLRESGFIQVQVTGKSGDGGIDGKGIVQINGFLNFHVMFQCKRYKGSVGSSQVRDFRGAMSGRSDKGLIITTGTFTRDAYFEASRDGVPPIDLIDGEMLIDKLKELSLGVVTRLVEKVEINEEWFENL
ncbi:Mrr restriction system protein [Sulfuricurvum sp.]|uniref:restriction endonuclease n=1 Tax=Sulfuricurvum sp. TaxID=2025608 RepID=UPI0025F0CD83|nr:Mrr restriction system protein [Sulfuricurvum sp.]